MARLGWKYDEVEMVNGFSIDRERIGSAVYWHAIRVNEDDYVTASYRNCGSKAKARTSAKRHKDKQDQGA